MRRRRMAMRTSVIVLLLVVVLSLAGCGGGGAGTPQVKTASSYLDDQATLSALLVHWLPVVFSGSYREDYVPQCPVEEWLNETYWEGAVLVTHRRWRQSDCGEAEVFQRDYPDGLSSIEETILYPDGTRFVMTQTQEWSTSPNGVIAHTQITFRSGARMASVMTIFWDPGMPMNTEEGTLSLPDGRRMQFERTRWGDREDLEITSAEGWHLTASFPCLGVLQEPDTSKAATGSLVSPRATTDFSLTGDGEAWTNLSTSSGDISGTFLVGRGPVEGRGTVWVNGETLATLSWDDEGVLRVSYADGTSAAYTPSAAARDFMIDRWLWQLGEYGPNPR